MISGDSSPCWRPPPDSGRRSASRTPHELFGTEWPRTWKRRRARPTAGWPALVPRECGGRHLQGPRLVRRGPTSEGRPDRCRQAGADRNEAGRSVCRDRSERVRAREREVEHLAAAGRKRVPAVPDRSCLLAFVGSDDRPAGVPPFLARRSRILGFVEEDRGGKRDRAARLVRVATLLAAHRTYRPRYDRVIPHRTPPDPPSRHRTGRVCARHLGCAHGFRIATPEPEPHDDPEAAATVEFPARPIYRALLVRGLQPSEAANLTAWLAGLPCAGLHWTIPEVDAVLRRRAELRRPGASTICRW